MKQNMRCMFNVIIKFLNKKIVIIKIKKVMNYLW